jgi:uncharacterized protein YceK
VEPEQSTPAVVPWRPVVGNQEEGSLLRVADNFYCGRSVRKKGLGIARVFALLFALLVCLPCLLAGCAGVVATPPAVEALPEQRAPAAQSEPQAQALVLPVITRFSDAGQGETLPGGWRVWSLGRFKKPTEYRLERKDGRTVVRAFADASASGLLHDLDVDPRQHPWLHWRWKVEQLIHSADNTQRHTEDSPVRLVITFAGDRSKLEFSDRLFATQVRLLTGQELPYATLMYIWENRAERGQIIANRHTSRIRMVVAESGREKLGRWWEESRNVLEDYRRAFGEEPGRITAIGLMTDTDNTGEQVHAWYGDIQFLARPTSPHQHPSLPMVAR